MSGAGEDGTGETPVDRRTLLTGLGAAAAGGLVPATATSSRPRVRELATPQLPTWTQTEEFEEVTTKFGGTNRGVVLDKRRAVVTRSISQVNMKLWDDDDVVAEECSIGGTRSVGHQHRFVVATRIATLEELPLSYYHTLGYDFDRGINVREPLRVPATRGLHAHDQLRTDVSVASDPCNPVTLRINAVNDQRLPAGEFSPGAALLTGEEFAYDAGDLAADVRRFARRNGPNPHMPESRQGLSGVAQSVLGDVGGTAGSVKAGLDTGQKIGIEAYDAIEDVSDLPRGLRNLSRLSSAVGNAASYGGLVFSGLDVLQALNDRGDPVFETIDWTANSVVANSRKPDGGVAVQFVDFTVTVPPGTAGGDGLTIELSQKAHVDDLVADQGKNSLVADRQDILPNDELLGTVSWEIDVPSYDVDDVRNVPETPTAYLVTGDGSSGAVTRSSTVTDGAGSLYSNVGSSDHRTAFASAPVPEFDVSVSDDRIRETESISFAVDGYDDDGDTSYRWRVYKLGGVTRPYVHYGRSGRIGPDVLSRTETAADPTIHAFGPGVYAAELTVRNQYGKVGRSAAGFEVTPRDGGVTGTEVALDSPTESLNVGDTLTVDVEGTVGRDGTPESLDRVEWALQYPATVAGGVRNRRAELRATDGFDSTFDPPFDLRPVEWNPPNEPPKTTFEHTFQHPGSYRLSIVAFSVEGDDGAVRARYYDGGDETWADRRDLTVFVGGDS